MAKRIFIPSKEPRKVDATLLPAELPETKALAMRIFSTSTYALNLPPDLTLDQYVSLAPRFGHMAKCMLWWVGDYLVYGETCFGEKHRDVIDNLSKVLAGYYRKGTLESARWVSKNIPPRERRQELSWNHHQLVAKMKDRHERKYWLDRAADKGWSTRDMTRQMAADRKAKQGPRRSGAATGYDRFPNDALLVKVEEATKTFCDAFETAMLQWRTRNMFDHHALRPKAAGLHDALGNLLGRLVPEPARRHPAAIPIRRFHLEEDAGAPLA